MINNDYVLIDCGLIHKYAVKRDNVKKIEDKTLYTVKVIKDLGNYKLEDKECELIFDNGIERLIFLKTFGSSTDDIFKYYLDEFKSYERNKDILKIIESLKAKYTENNTKLESLDYKSDMDKWYYLRGLSDGFYRSLFTLGYDVQKDEFWK